MADQGTATRRVGRYEIIRIVGRGGVAVVYLARQLDLERSVALKELSAFQLQSSHSAERFLREARLAGSLSHPNIVTVHEYFEQDGIPYIAMEYVPRGSLRPLVGKLSLAQLAGVLEGVLAGLVHAEEAGIVHRDLKPENLMVTREGRVKIADFGIAKATQTAGVTAALTATGSTVGTPTYMAPEQAMGDAVGPWTDLYSVGIMTYEHVTGQPPFRDTGAPIAVLMSHVNDPIPPAAEVDPGVDRSVSDWIDRLLVKAPGDRTQNAAAAWDELEEIVINLLGPRWRREALLSDPQAGSAQGPGPSTPAPLASAASGRATDGPGPTPAAAAPAEEREEYVTFGQMDGSASGPPGASEPPAPSGQAPDSPPAAEPSVPPTPQAQPEPMLEESAPPDPQPEYLTMAESGGAFADEAVPGPPAAPEYEVSSPTDEPLPSPPAAPEPEVSSPTDEPLPSPPAAPEPEVSSPPAEPLPSAPAAAEPVVSAAEPEPASVPPAPPRVPPPDRPTASPPPVSGGKRRRRLALLLIPALIVLGGVAAVIAATSGGSSSTPSATSVASSAASQGATTATQTGDTVHISMKSLAFNPTVIHATVGQKVLWFNEDNAPHNVTYVSGPSFTSSKTLFAGHKFEIALTKAGTIQYYCTIHPWMKASIVVTQ